MEKTASLAFGSLDPSSVLILETSSLPQLLSLCSIHPKLEDDCIASCDGGATGTLKKDDFVRWAVRVEAERVGGGNVQLGRLDGEDEEEGRGDGAEELLRRVGELEGKSRRMHETDVFEAAYTGNLELLQSFASIDPSFLSNADETEFGSRYTPLHYAAYSGHLNCVEFIVEESADANIDARTTEGCTPLFLASQQGHVEVVKFLLRNEADVAIYEEENKFTPVDVARLHREEGGVFSVFESEEEWEYAPWRAKPGKLQECKIEDIRKDSFLVLLPSLHIAIEEQKQLKVREYKVKVVDVASGAIVDLVVVPREEWEGGVEEGVRIRGLGRREGTKYIVFVAGINGMGYGEYSDGVEVEIGTHTHTGGVDVMAKVDANEVGAEKENSIIGNLEVAKKPHRKRRTKSSATDGDSLGTSPRSVGSVESQSSSNPKQINKVRPRPKNSKTTIGKLEGLKGSGRTSSEIKGMSGNRAHTLGS